MTNEGDKLLGWTREHFPQILKSGPQEIFGWSNFISAFTVAPGSRRDDNSLERVISRTIEFGLQIKEQGASVELLMSAIAYSMSLAEPPIDSTSQEKILKTIKKGLK